MLQQLIRGVGSDCRRTSRAPFCIFRRTERPGRANRDQLSASLTRAYHLDCCCRRLDGKLSEESKNRFSRSLTTRKVVVEVLSMADERVSRRVAERKKFVSGPVEVEIAGRFSQYQRELGLCTGATSPPSAKGGSNAGCNCPKFVSSRDLCQSEF